MHVACSRTQIKEALRIVSGVVDPRNIKPILKDIRIHVADESIELSATDLEVGIKYYVKGVKVKEQGGIVVPAEPVTGIMSESRDEQLVLRIEDNKLMVEGKGSRFHIVGIPEEEFPEIPEFPEGNFLEIEGAILREMIEKTIFAVATEKQRYALNGVLLVTKERSAKIEMIATDGRRLAMIRRKANSAVAFTSSVIIPVKALQQAQKMLGAEEIVKISIQERQVLMKTENAILIAQLVEGRFPAYKEVLPDDCDKRLEMGRSDIMNAIRQAAVLTAKESRAICLRADKEGIVIESNDPAAGDARVQLEAKYEGGGIEIRFNPDYLIDGLKAITEDTVRIEMKDSSRAAVMRASADYLYLIMPITQE